MDAADRPRLNAIAGPLLGERVARGTWIAILTGLAGVLIVVRPGGALLGWTVLLPLAAAFCNSLYQILTRSFAGSENGTTIRANICVSTPASRHCSP